MPSEREAQRNEAGLTITQGNKNNYFFPSTLRAAGEKKIAEGTQVNFLKRCGIGAEKMAGFPGEPGSIPSTHIERGSHRL